VTPAIERDLASSIRLLVLDVDGVLTDAHLVIGPRGEEYKHFYARDGSGIRLALLAGIEVAFLSARESDVVSRRAEMLGVREVHQGKRKKLDALVRLVERLGITLSEVAYVGDDIVDIPPAASVGMGVAVADACDDLKRAASFVTALPGGGGAVRETVEAILRARGDWEEHVQDYLEAQR
jgi:3-deoxy-D-manno-octulosonate 8-phosphate phosphatase (KDO 8-P phosphatase)